MSYAQDTGYTPRTVEEILEAWRIEINDEWSLSYDAQSFVGSQYYKFFYRAAQMVQREEVKTGQTFQKLQDYFTTINDRIQRPTTTYPGLVEALEDAGYNSSMKPPSSVDAGTVFICIDVDDTDPDYATIKQELLELISTFIAGGMFFEGTEQGDVVISNGQNFPFAYFLPNRRRTYMRITLKKSDNSNIEIPDDVTLRTLVRDNVLARYKMGWDFEPERYLTQAEVLWAADLTIEYSFNLIGWDTEVYQASFDDLLQVALGDIQIYIED